MCRSRIHYAFVLFITFLFRFSCVAQSSGDYRSNASNMNWSDASKWQTWDATKQSWIEATAAPSYLDGTITIQTTHVVTVTTALTIDQLIINGVLINSGNKVIINDGLADDVQLLPGGKYVNIGSAASTVNRGQWRMNDSLLNMEKALFTNEGMLENDGAIFKNKGTLINASNALLINKGEFLVGGKISMQNKSTYQHNFDSDSLTAGSIPTATWEAGSICEIIACGSAFQPGVLNQTFHHFIWNNSTQPHDFNLVANPNQVNGNFEVKNTNGKKLSYKGSVTGNLHVADSLKITGGTFVFTNGTAKSFIETATYYQDAGVLDMSASAASGTLTVFKAFTHAGGIILLTGKADSCSILLKGAAAATLESIGFRNGDKILLQINKSASSGTCFVASNKILRLNAGTMLQVLDNKFADIDFQVDGSVNVYTPSWSLNEGLSVVNGTWINSSPATGTRLSTTTSLHFNANSLYVHAADGGELPLATWNPASTIALAGITKTSSIQNSGQSFGNILWSSAQQEQPFTFGAEGFDVQGTYTIETTGKSVLNFPDCDFTIRGDLILQNNSTLQLAASSGLFNSLKRTTTIVGNVSVLNTAAVRVGNPTASQPMNTKAGLSRTYELELKKDFIYTSTTPLISYHQHTGVGSTNGACYNLLLTFNGNGLQHLQVPPQPLGLGEVSEGEYISKNLYAVQVSGTGTCLQPQQHNICINQLDINTADTLVLSKEDIQIDLYPARNLDGTNKAPTCSVQGTLDLGKNILNDGNSNGSFALAPNATLVTMHPEGIDSSGNTGCIRATGTRYFDSQANYIYNGHAPQITGNGLPAILSGSLTIKNSTVLKNGGVGLTNNTLLTGTLRLTQGKLVSSPSQLLSIDNNGLVLPEGGSNNAFVEGPMQKKGLLAGTEFIFPTGDKDSWARISITPHAATISDYTASYQRENPKSIGISKLEPELTAISTREYWLVEKRGTPEMANVKLFWEVANASGNQSVTTAELKIAHADTTNKLPWKSELLNLLTTGTDNSGTIQATAQMTTSDAFTFGSKLALTPLPIELISFVGKRTATGNLLTWATASEKNNQFFEVQRSRSGTQFLQIGTLIGQGNSTSITAYAFTDTANSDDAMYYRLKQIDFDGKFTYSPIILIENKNIPAEFIIFPNPCSSENVHIRLSSSIEKLAIYNVLGDLVYEVVAANQECSFKPKASGVYIIIALVNKGKSITKKLIVN